MAKIPILVNRYDWIRRALGRGIHLNCREIGERLGICRKSAQRYISRLRQDGYRIEYDAALNGYRLAPPARKQPDCAPALRVLRRAAVWARRRENSSANGLPIPWLAEAENILRKGEY